jgi:hypothetical protein
MTSKARMRRAFDKHLDRVEAASRLAHLRDASGNFNPVHQARYFRVSWEHARFMDRFMSWHRAHEKEKSARYYLRDAYGRDIPDDE